MINYCFFFFFKKKKKKKKKKLSIKKFEIVTIINLNKISILRVYKNLRIE